MEFQWPGVRVLKLPETERVQRLTALRSFYEGTQHGHKKHDFAGRSRKGSNAYVLERLRDLGFEPVHKPPIAERKPDTPVPLERQVIKGFDGMIYPRGLSPTLETPADPRTGRFLRDVFARSLTWASLQEARTIAGGCGEAAVRIYVDEHRPKSEPLDTRELFVREWADKADHIPSVVVWQRLVEIEEEEDDGLKCRKVWRTRVFDDTNEYLYQDVDEDYGSKREEGKSREEHGETEKTGWIPIAVGEDGQPMIVPHRAGRCPVVWIQNTRCTTDTAGEPDCDGVHELADKVDLVVSMAARATVSNLDPTLHVADTNQWHNRNRHYAKGWGEVIRTSQDGRAALLETSGGTVEMGLKTYRMLRDAMLQTTQAVIIDPETAGKYATSGVAYSMLWRPMEAAAGRKRVPQESAIEQLATMWTNLGIELKVSSTEDDSPVGIVLPPVKLEKRTAEAQGYVLLDEQTEDGDDVLAVHQVGHGRHVQILWPPFHEASPEQFSAVSSGVTTSVESKVMSKKTGIMLTQRAAGIPVNVEAEQAQLAVEANESAERQMAFADGLGAPRQQTMDEEDEDGEEEPENDGEDDEG